MNHADKADRSDGADAMTQLILKTFRANGQLLEVGDRITAPFGLSSARWQVLGALAGEGRPLAVAQIARRMGLTRQSVRRTVSDLVELGFVELADNPDHKRAKLVVLTPLGIETLTEVTAVQAELAEYLAADLDPQQLRQTLALLGQVIDRCESFKSGFSKGDSK